MLHQDLKCSSHAAQATAAATANGIKSKYVKIRAKEMERHCLWSVEMRCDAMIRKRKQYLCCCAKNTSNENRHRTNIFIRCATTTFMNAIRLHFDGVIEIEHSLNALARKRKKDREIWMENYLPNCKHRWHTMTYSRDRAKSIRILRSTNSSAHKVQRATILSSWLVSGVGCIC